MGMFRALCVFLLVFLSQTSVKLFGVDVRHCFIKNSAKHACNQRLLEEIVEQELVQSAMKRGAEDQATYLSSRLQQIVHSLLERGFSVDAYAVPEIDQRAVVSFNCFSLWEGDRQADGAVPLTFFVYIWPSEVYSLKHNSCEPRNSQYGSIVHRHPIPCAFAVLSGALSQSTYEEEVQASNNERCIRCIKEEIFQVGEGESDDLRVPFIHKLYNPGTHSTVTLSLHAYRLPSAEKVMNCFRNTFSQCSYEHCRVLK